MVSILRRVVIAICVIAVASSSAVEVKGGNIVVGHDVNTLGTFVAGTNEATFAVNVANSLTAGDATKNLLLFEATPGDGSRDYAPVVLNALSAAGFNVTVTTNYATSFTGFNAIFVAEQFPSITFLNNNAMINYVNSGGGVYLAGGVGNNPAVESAGWNTFLNHFGLAFATQYNGINNVPITSSNPIFAGVTSLNSGNGQSIINLGTDPNAQIVQFDGSQGVYAVVSSAVPEPTSFILLLLGAGLSFVSASRPRDPIRQRTFLASTGWPLVRLGPEALPRSIGMPKCPSACPVSVRPRRAQPLRERKEGRAGVESRCGAVALSYRPGSVSTPRSSNWTGGFPASSFRYKAFLTSEFTRSFTRQCG